MTFYKAKNAQIIIALTKFKQIFLFIGNHEPHFLILLHV